MKAIMKFPDARLSLELLSSGLVDLFVDYCSAFPQTSYGVMEK